MAASMDGLRVAWHQQLSGGSKATRRSWSRIVILCWRASVSGKCVHCSSFDRDTRWRSTWWASAQHRPTRAGMIIGMNSIVGATIDLNPADSSITFRCRNDHAL